MQEAHRAYRAEAQITQVLGPPLGFWICETVEIQNLWEDHLKFAKLADNHKIRHTHMLIEMEKLGYDLPPDKSAIFMDGDELIMVVLRNFCSQPDVVKWVDDVVRSGIRIRRSVWVCV